MRAPVAKPPPELPRPDGFVERCICYGTGKVHASRTEFATCDRCGGAGWRRMTHEPGSACPDRLPGFCTSCGCECSSCRSRRASAPRWHEFEQRRGQGSRDAFVTWAADPFVLSNGTTYRHAILQPWPTAGLVVQLVMSGLGGRVEECEGFGARSRGAFYEDMGGDHPSSAVEAAKIGAASMAERMRTQSAKFDALLARRVKAS